MTLSSGALEGNTGARRRGVSSEAIVLSPRFVRQFGQLTIRFVA
jgi:hypothetical protein